jgi:hypothetical protein
VRTSLFRQSLVATALVALACAPDLALAGPGPERTPSLRLSRPDDPRAAFEVVGLDRDAREALRSCVSDRERASVIFAIRVESRAKDPLPLLGSYELEGDVLRFRPRFPLERGLRYRAVFKPGLLPGASSQQQARVIEAEFSLPRPPASSTTHVVQVFPSRATIPENQLKFYVQFSAPMSRGGIYRRIHLLDESGKAVVLPFLEIPEELWDPSGTRLTLLFDPGRIKTGLKPREEMGPILQAGHSYTLVIDREWPDAEGNPLRACFRKTYRAGPADLVSPDPSAWKLEPPAPRTHDPLRLRFPEPLDRALLARALGVLDAQGRLVPGEVTIEDEETAWTLRPTQPWAPGAYRIVIDKDLEDLAGNQIGRVFEVDIFDKIEAKQVARTAELTFRIEGRSGD